MGNWEKEFALKLELVCAWRRDWEVWNRRGCWRLAVELGTGRMLLERQEARPVAHIRGCLCVSVPLGQLLSFLRAGLRLKDFGIKGGIRINLLSSADRASFPAALSRVLS